MSYKKPFYVSPDGLARVVLLLFEEPVNNEEDFIIAVGKKPEKLQGISEAVAHPFQAPVKGFPGGPLFPLGEHFKQVAAPEPQAAAKVLVVFDDPLLAAADPPAHQQQGGGSLAYGLEDSGLLLALEAAYVAAHYPQAGEGLAYVFFSYLEDPGFSPQKVHGQFPVFQNREQVDGKIEGHIPDGGFSGKKADAPEKAFRDGDHQAGVQHKGTVLPAPPGPEEVPKGKEDDVPARTGGQKFINDFGQPVGGHNINRNF
jgi:hypothetical protein